MTQNNELPSPYIIDSELLDRFVNHGDEAALTLLIRKHSALVMSVCRQIVDDQHEAEDVFQAVFLKLVQKGATIKNGAFLTSWLYRVSYHEACQTNRRRKKQMTVEYNDENITPTELAHHTQSKQQFVVLHEEVERLPERYRGPLILCYLNSMSRKEAADELQVTDAAVKARLMKGRELLRKRLLKRGIAMAAILASWRLDYAQAAANASTEMINKTIEQCLSYSGAEAGATLSSPNSLSQASLNLGQKVMPAVSRTSLAVCIGGAILIAGALITGISISGSDEQSDAKSTSKVSKNADGEISGDSNQIEIKTETNQIGASLNSNTIRASKPAAGAAPVRRGRISINGSNIGGPAEPPSDSIEVFSGVGVRSADDPLQPPLGGSPSGGGFGAGTINRNGAGTK
ncbi:RNA polymerase sigma factor [Polystyrenella longa]|nr:sigma-70 family RNA polymerase sigma factor [Polystyrenella longa]